MVTEINSVVEEEDVEFEMGKSSLVVSAGAGLKKNIFGKHALFVDGTYAETFISPGGKISSLSIRLGFLF
jgi:hypothetical protein